MPHPRLSLLTAALALPLGIGAFVLTPPAAADHHQGETAVATGSVMDVLAADDRFSTLVGLLESSGLDNTLSEHGPFTLFAPTNEAFEKGDPEKRDAILNAKKRLEKALLGHVVEGRMTASDLEAAGKVESLAEKPLKVKAKKDGLYVGNRKVLTADVDAENGLIHVMDEAFLPRLKTDDADTGNEKKKGKGEGKGKKKGDGGVEDPE